MGKIFNALEKYRQERLLTRQVPKLRNADREALLKYDRDTGKLNLKSGEVIKDSETIQRLLANKMISPDGQLTAAGRKMAAEYRERRIGSTTGKHHQSIEQNNHLQKSAESVPPIKLKESDLSVLMQYDRETKNIINYDPENCQLNESSKALLREPDVIQRLIDNGIILPGGWLTSKGLQVIEKIELSKKKGYPENLDSREIEQEPREEKKSIEIIEEATKETKKLQPLETVRRVKEKMKEAIKADDTSILNKKTSIVSANKRIGAEILPPEIIEDTQKETKKEDISEVPSVMAVKKAPKVSSYVGREKKIIGTKPASVPYQSEAIDENLVSQLNPQSFEAEQFKILRTNLLYPVSGKIPRSIAVTSSLPGEGKSFVAANLAISIAREIDRYTLLIDCDLRRPRVHSLFGFNDVPGLSDYLSGGIPLESLLFRTKIDKLSILPAGPIPENPSELLSSEQMSAMLQEVSVRYKDRLIILDTPPPTVTAETGVLANFVEGILVVVKYGKTTRENVEDLVRAIGKEKIIGCVLNNVDLRSSMYSKYRKYRGQYYSTAAVKGKS